MQAGSTYTPIATTTLGSAQSTISFTSISGSYTDLRLVLSGAVTNVCDIVSRFNSDSSGIYSWTRLTGNGSTAASSRVSNSTEIRASIGNPSTTSPFIINLEIMSYSNTNTFKTCINGFSDAANAVGKYVGLYRSTSAITTVSVIADGDTFKTGTTATLYGIAAA